MTAARPAPAITVRTGLSAGGYLGCLAYCDQERNRCYANPQIPRAVCDDRYPVCQNACAACSASTY